jgi:hypothetical protein
VHEQGREERIYNLRFSRVGAMLRKCAYQRKVSLIFGGGE